MMTWIVRLLNWMWGHREEIVHDVEDLTDDAPHGTPLPHKNVDQIEAQIEKATRHGGTH